MKKTLLQKTQALIASTSVPAVEICRTVGVSTRWFSRFKRGDFHDPGVRKIQAIHDFLSKAKRKAV